MNGLLVVPDTWGCACAVSADSEIVFQQGGNTDEIILKGVSFNTIEKIVPVHVGAWQEANVE